MTFVETTVSAMIGKQLQFFSTPASAAAGVPDGDVSVYLLINEDGDRRWAVQPGHDGHGTHTQLADAVKAEDWFEDDWAYTTDAELAAAHQ